MRWGRQGRGDKSENTNELAAHDRRSSSGRGHSRRRSGTARAVGRSARPRALSLHTVAARSFHAAEPAGEATLAVGLRSARRTAGKAAIAAHTALLTSALAAFSLQTARSDRLRVSSRSPKPCPTAARARIVHVVLGFSGNLSGLGGITTRAGAAGVCGQPL